MASVSTRRLLQIYWILGMLVTKEVLGSLVMDYNKDYFKEEEEVLITDLNPCSLIDLENPHGFCYCHPDNMDKAENVKCGFTKNPKPIEWKAISRLRATNEIDFVSRPAGAIQEIPPDYVFTGMKSLYYFTMKIANISVIPSFAFGNSSGLAEIFIQDNEIRELMPNAFANMANLTAINLSENRLTEIRAKVFVNLPKLKELVMMKNSIHTIHAYAFQDLKILEDLDLQYNHLTVLTREVFFGMERMKNLNLQGNQLQYIGDHVFAEMPRLQDLDLNGNDIHSIHPNGFGGLRFITRLNLKDNKIVNLHPETFSPLSKVHFLDLRYNQLESLEASLMQPIYRNLKNVNMQLLLEGNRFACDCRILWLQKLYNETESSYVQKHISMAICDFYENMNKQTSKGGSTRSHGITILTSPPEETTTYSYDSSRSVLNLTESELGCGSGSNHFTTYHYHQPTPPKGYDEHALRDGDGNYGKVAIDFDMNRANSQIEKKDRHRNADAGGNLHEPEATAALEGGVFKNKTPLTSEASSSTSSSSSFALVCDSFLLMASAIVLLLLSFHSH